MGLATHLGPWALGTVKETTGTTAGAIRNVGVTIVTQTKKVVYDGAAASLQTAQIAVLPAGAQIINMHTDTLVAFTGSSAANMTLGTAGSTAAYWASTDITAQGRLAIAGAATKLVAWAGVVSAAAPDGVGIGATDVVINAYVTPTVAAVTAGTVQYTIIYAVRNDNGTSAPASA